jgi:hypothetical protein
VILCLTWTRSRDGAEAESTCWQSHGYSPTFPNYCDHQPGF